MVGAFQAGAGGASGGRLTFGRAGVGGDQLDQGLDQNATMTAREDHRARLVALIMRLMDAGDRPKILPAWGIEII